MRKIDTRSFVRATRSTARKINSQIALNLVREHGPISRADLARRLRVGRGMVTALVDELLEVGVIVEGASVDAPRGRRPRMLFVRTRDRLAVAIDVRFSQTSLMLTDFAGTPIAMQIFETIADPRALVAELKARISRLLKQHRAAGKCDGIGLVVPGMVDQQTGRVLNAPQLAWRDVDVRTALAKATGFPVHIENAPIACALAQMWLGQRGLESPRDFVYVTVSDGVGAGVVVNGEVVRGHGNSAGEFGHVPLELNGPRCLCGARGCLEAYTSNLATLCRYLGNEFSPESARTLMIESGLTIADVITRALSGEERATRALEETARYLGIGLAVIINALNPDQIFVGGEITAVWDRISPVIRREIETRALTARAAGTPVSPELGTYPRLRGATALVAAPMFAAPRVA
ncbi:MAG TPA: ROK family transcriptional regulator [Gemmatimonadaceae bacterium]|nr:ROK family transcriptional regulator [Gemmatimonadaceae bacterium]